jgi:osmotically-inducible protein OsmY
MNFEAVTMNRYLMSIVLSILLGLGISGCAPLVAGAAVGVAGTVAIYDRQTLKEKAVDFNMANVILQHLLSDPEIKKQCHVAVTAYHGTVLLVGQAPTLELRERIEEVARSDSGIQRFYNEITINGPSSLLTRTSDTWITTKVKSLLLATKGLHSGQIKVLTEDSTVFLLGVVSRSQADFAVNATKRAKGVKKVVKVFQYTS